MRGIAPVRKPSNRPCRRTRRSSWVQDRVVIGRRLSVIRRTYRLGTVERVVRERKRCIALVIDRHNLKRRPAAVDHREARALAHTLNDVGKRCPQALLCGILMAPWRSALLRWAVASRRRAARTTQASRLHDPASAYARPGSPRIRAIMEFTRRATRSGREMPRRRAAATCSALSVNAIVGAENGLHSPHFLALDCRPPGPGSLRRLDTN